MSEPINQQTGPGDPASKVEASETAGASKQPASNWDYADGFMMGLEDRGWTRLDRDLEDDIREQVDSLLEKLDATGMEVRIGSLERALERVEGERDQQLRRVAELERERGQLRAALEGLMEWCRCDCVAELERNQPMAPSGQPAATDRELAECAWSLAKAVERRLGQLEALFPTVEEPGAKGLGKIRMLSCREVAEMVCIEREVSRG